MKRYLPLAFVLALPITASALAQPAPALFDAEGCIADYRPGVDYFPDKAVFEYASNVSVSYHDSYKLVTVEQPFVGGSPVRYVLVQCGAPTPALDGDFANAVIVEIPVETMFVTSTTHNPMLEALDAIDRITGVGTLAFTTTQAILDAGAAGAFVEFATTGVANVEVVIDADPDVLFTDGGEDPGYDTLRAVGIPVVAAAEWLEDSILGRAEWIKYLALFLNSEGVAEAVFESIEASYLDAAALVAAIPESDRPVVLAGSAFQGVFYASGGRSYVAQSIADAGGRYVFADDRGTASIAFGDLEVILDRGADADIWINSATWYATLADIVADEPRLAALPAAQAGQVWNYDLIQTAAGGVGFFELGVLRPDLVLRDLIAIFHPGTLPDHNFVFYRPIRLE